MPGPRIDRVRRDTDYLRKHEVHRLFNNIANDLLLDRPRDVLSYLQRWVTTQLQVRDYYPAELEEDDAYDEDGKLAADCDPHLVSSRYSESARSFHSRASGPGSQASPSHQPVSRQSSINLLRRAYPSSDHPEQVRYPPTAADFETWADPTVASRAIRDSTRLESPTTASNADWRPSAAELSQRFPDPNDLFVVGELVSSGHYGSVFQGTKVATGELLAIKKVAIDGHWVVSEYDNLVHCVSPYVVRCEGCYYSVEEDLLWLAMEFLPHTMERDLPEEKYLREEYIAGLIKETLLALRDVHARNRVHLDVKPANLLFTDSGHLKLGDLGTMATIGDPCIQLGDFCFMAPEVAYSQGLFTDRSDIWSVGAVTITLADGAPPLCREDPKLLMHIHHETCMVPSLWEPFKWSPEMRDFLSRCFVKDISFRPSAKEMLQHPWIVQRAVDPRLLAQDKFQRGTRGVRQAVEFGMSLSNCAGD
eukprot:GGOE01044885.1.p1 GENE.GGOE01044885.1~~GGOE01044885.1.p1  ORF type:complete len:477 (+),score=124.25 GGOE01044885.1:116-1546(+)